MSLVGHTIVGAAGQHSACHTVVASFVTLTHPVVGRVEACHHALPKRRVGLPPSPKSQRTGHDRSDDAQSMKTALAGEPQCGEIRQWVSREFCYLKGWQQQAARYSSVNCDKCFTICHETTQTDLDAYLEHFPALALQRCDWLAIVDWHFSSLSTVPPSCGSSFHGLSRMSFGDGEGIHLPNKVGPGPR
ncbi:hypothetical protein B0H66DRAFT_545002 [Apodospora peruviana]|uniref:Uncharacterized protein n=1 Tax=Apodospora peruviana TaxID=516989 RepID=A0AAE0ITT7_9PEZI|nr:hypothetical protein B0H66DRAFT_545002 [Apodospora peruviana]